MCAPNDFNYIYLEIFNQIAIFAQKHLFSTPKVFDPLLILKKPSSPHEVPQKFLPIQ